MTTMLAACGGGGPEPGPSEPVASGPEPTLSSMSLSAGSLDQPFQDSQRSYSATQPHLVAGLSLLIGSPDAAKQVRVEGQEVTPGEPSSPVPLSVGINRIVVEVERADPAAIGTYRVDVERLAANSVVTTAELREGDGLPADSRQGSMALSGDRLALQTLIGTDPQHLEVRMFRREGEAWVEEAVIPAPDPDRPGGFGTALALHEEVLVVGAPTEDKQSVDPDRDLTPLVGAAYMYRRQGEAWVLEARLAPPEPQRQHFFGRSAAVHGKHLIVGAPHETVIDEGAEKLLAGAIYVYAREQASWELVARLTAPEPAPGAFVGDSLALDASHLIVTAPREGAGLPEPCVAGPGLIGPGCPASNEGQGALYVHALEGDIPGEPIRLDSEETGESGRLGTRLAFDGQRIAATAPLAEPSGAVVIWRATANGWQQDAVLRPPPEVTTPSFGSALDLAEGMVAVGIPTHDDGATGFDPEPTGTAVRDNGAVLLYERSASGWMAPIFVQPPVALERQRFGEALALGGGRLLVSQQPLAGATTFPVTSEAAQALFFMR